MGGKFQSGFVEFSFQCGSIEILDEHPTPRKRFGHKMQAARKYRAIFYQKGSGFEGLGHEVLVSVRKEFCRQARLP